LGRVENGQRVLAIGILQEVVGVLLENCLANWYDGKLVVKGWAVEWSEHSQGKGIPVNEVSALRVFLRACVKLLPEAIALAEKMRGEMTGSRRQINQPQEAPHPAVRLYGGWIAKDVQYCIEIMWDGSVFLYRLINDKAEPDPFVGSLDYVGDE